MAALDWHTAAQAASATTLQHLGVTGQPKRHVVFKETKRRLQPLFLYLTLEALSHLSPFPCVTGTPTRALRDVVMVEPVSHVPPFMYHRSVGTGRGTWHQA